MACLEEIKQELDRLADPEKARQKERFFQAFPGGYGEGDRFNGVAVPFLRKIARRYWREIPLEEAEMLLRDPIHERRLTALFILCLRFAAAGRAAAKRPGEREKIAALYLRNLSFVNNWDLVDSSAHLILGPYLIDKDKTLLFELAGSGDLWKQRVAVIATFHFIRNGRYGETLKLAERLLSHRHDLMHKAVGWMLREIGNRDPAVEEEFLRRHCREMPRTMLRYAIEKFEPARRGKYLRGSRNRRP